ncbi:MAG: low molecular weight phosphotyrosine protein phosphatase [Ideonella sp.]|nr:low molecular weight phosphotyrosine protein phosphatase [Ideonella sp.]
MVCTGNICRSPTAEGVLRRKLVDAGLGRLIEVDSAGTTDYHAGSPPDPRAQESAGRRGYDLSRLRARQVRASDFERFDLLLAMEAVHVQWLTEACPPAKRDRIGLLMDHARGRPPGGAVPDPYYGAPAGFEHVLDLVEDACEGLLATLRQRALERARPDPD